MPYFFILPAYVAFLMALVCAAFVAHFVTPFRRASKYIFAGAVGTLFGFVITNFLVWIVGLFPVWLDQKISLSDWLRHIFQLFVGMTLLIGPFIGSAIGVLLGFAAGIYFIYKRRRVD